VADLFERPVVELTGVTRTFVRGPVPVRALRGVDLTVERGEIVVLIGPSGCGKTTLLHVIGGLDRADSGRVVVAGVDLAEASQGELDRFRREHVGMVLQSENLVSTATARDQVALGLLARGRPWRRARNDAMALLGDMGLTERAGHRPHELSGGEQQRVALARALGGIPDLVLADEPTGELDSATAAEITGCIVRQCSEHGTTFVIASHDRAFEQYASRVVRLRDGVVEADR
jgi:putative ABC transport system ATP-binding protein